MKKMTYEEALSKLEKIVESLEDGSISLDESMKMFEEGTKLSLFCEKCLNEAEQKITELKDGESDE